MLSYQLNVYVCGCACLWYESNWIGWFICTACKLPMPCRVYEVWFICSLTNLNFLTHYLTFYLLVDDVFSSSLFSLLSSLSFGSTELSIDQMKTLCKTHFLQMVYRKTDGAVLWSQNERNLDCALTFQTHSILQRFLMRFDTLQLDCNDHLYIYDGAHATGVPKVSMIIMP